MVCFCLSSDTVFVCKNKNNYKMVVKQHLVNYCNMAIYCDMVLLHPALKLLVLMLKDGTTSKVLQ